MSKQPPADLAAEQRAEIRQWAREIANDALHAHVNADYATIAHLHKAMARLMSNYQTFRKQQATLQAEVIQHMIDEAGEAQSSQTQDMTVR